MGCSTGHVTDMQQVLLLCCVVSHWSTAGEAQAIACCLAAHQDATVSQQFHPHVLFSHHDHRGIKLPAMHHSIGVVGMYQVSNGASALRMEC